MYSYGDPALIATALVTLLHGTKEKIKKVPTEEYAQKLEQFYSKGTIHKTSDNEEFIVVMEPDISKDWGYSNKEDKDYILLTIRYLSGNYTNFDISKLDKGTICRLNDKNQDNSIQYYNRDQYMKLQENGCVNVKRTNILACNRIKLWL